MYTAEPRPDRDDIYHCLTLSMNSYASKFQHDSISNIVEQLQKTKFTKFRYETFMRTCKYIQVQARICQES